MRVDIAAGTATGHGTNTLVTIEDAEGSVHNDVLLGNGKSNLMIGLEGDDSISGLGRRDFLLGDAGYDTLNGGPGFDDCIDGEVIFACEAVVVLGAPMPQVALAGAPDWSPGTRLLVVADAWLERYRR